MPNIVIDSINIDFPKDPYPNQVEYMKKVIEALNKKQNALLESPTGTGKTLSLLCATIAWQQSQVVNKPIHQQTNQSVNQTSNKVDFKINNKADNKFDTKTRSTIILYASRTHSQLKQVLNELKSINYKVKTILLGSRDQLCINTKLTNKLHGNALNNSCNSLVVKHSCHYKNNLDKFNVNSHIMDLLDIEELVTLGKQESICPYYYTKDQINQVTLILLPYNYLFDLSIRSKLSINWLDSIVIFDEAHNIERVACDSSSFTLSSIELTKCIQELQYIISNIRQPSNDITVDQSNLSNDNNIDIPTLQIVIDILKKLFEFERLLDEIQLTTNNITKSLAYVADGIFIKQLFDKVGFTSALIPSYKTELNKCIQYLLNDLSNNESNHAINLSEPKLTIFLLILTKVHIINNHSSYYNDFKVYVVDKPIDKSSKSNLKNRIINFWVFNCGIALNELKSLGVRSIIMTSGTLSPMKSFQYDMKIAFPVILENSHIIKENQVWLGAATVGVKGKQLNSSYNVRDTTDYKDELGLTIHTIIETMIGRSKLSSAGNLTFQLPIGSELKGGILVFFPSYSQLDSCLSRWKSNGMYNKLIQLVGHIVVEQSNSKLDNKVDKLDHPVDSNGDIPTGLVNEFEISLKNNGRCILFAVCRGKVSEGIDFHDERGRIVIITGIPYSPHTDPWIILKKQYLDEKISKTPTNTSNQIDSNMKYLNNWINKNHSTISISNNPKYIQTKTNSDINKADCLSGQDWYHQSAIRAVNQAVGRIIRHANDWGAIFLLDERYLQDKQNQHLSKWLRPRQTNYQTFDRCLHDFRLFINNAMDDIRLNPKQSTGPIVIDKRNLESVKQTNNNINITRKVIIKTNDIILNESKNILNDGISYIQPDLLSTQHQLQYYPNEIDNEKAIMLRIQQNQLNRRPENQISNNRNDQNISNNTSNSLTNTIFNRKNLIVSSTKSISKHDRQSINNSNTSSFSSIYPFADKLSNNYNNFTPSIKNTILSSQSNFKLQSSSWIANKPDSDLAISQSESTIVLSDHIKQLINSNEVEKLIDELKQFKNNIKSKQLSIKSLTTFMNTLLSHVISFLPNKSFEFIYSILDDAKLSCVTSDWIDSYDVILLSIIDQLKETNKNKPSNSQLLKPIKIEPNNDINVKIKPNSTINNFSEDDIDSYVANSEIVSNSQSVSKQDSKIFKYEPSKRARLQIKQAFSNDISLNPTNKPSKHTNKSIYELLQNQDLSINKSNQDTFNKVVCQICNELCVNKSNEPLVSRCGHICCTNCWTSWLNKKQTCPICRQETNINVLSKIIFK